MTVVAVGSVRGAPGVTTTALLLARQLDGPALLVEADVSGGTLAVACRLGREPGVTTLAVDARRGDPRWAEHTQTAVGVDLLVGPDAPDTARQLWDRAGGHLASALGDCSATVVVDVGRLTSSTPMLGTADVIVLLVRPLAVDLVALSHWLASPALAGARHRVRLVAVGSGEYSLGDLARSVDASVAGALPVDHRGAGLLFHPGRPASTARTRLFRAGLEVTATLQALVATRAGTPAAGGTR